MTCLKDACFKGKDIFFRATPRWEIENQLNDLGIIPIASTCSGLVRMAIFTTQTLIDTAKVVYFLARSLFLSSNSQLYTSAVLVMHDLSNIFRGGVEMLPFLGSRIVSLYDQNGYRFEYFPEDFRHIAHSTETSYLDKIKQKLRNTGYRVFFNQEQDILDFLTIRENPDIFLEELVKNCMQKNNWETAVVKLEKGILVVEGDNDFVTT